MTMSIQSNLLFPLSLLLGMCLLFAAGCKKSDPGQNTVTDIDNNVYPTVTIGTQTWMAKNLQTTKYNDGSQIPRISDDVTWINMVTGAYCYYGNDSASYADYGPLYNWVAVKTGKICPTGWHVPSDAEWTILEEYLGGYLVAGGALKESGTAHWASPNTAASNSSGFTALPGGMRSGNSGSFESIKSSGTWWTTTADTVFVQARQMVYIAAGVSTIYIKERHGCSVRCLKD
jgi:uncharacterized protein (TIGR02145 family)